MLVLAMPTIWYMNYANLLSNEVNRGQKVTKFDPSLKLSAPSKISFPIPYQNDFLRKNVFKWKLIGTLVNGKLKNMDFVHF